MELISIIVPCYNQAQYLDECLQSVLDQTYANWECIIVDDGSQDNTKEVANKWGALDTRFKYIYKLNGGLSSARNSGVSAAKGEFILPLDADDYISVDYLTLAMNQFNLNSNLKLVYSLAQKFGEINSLWELESFSLKKLAETNIVFCSGVYRKKDWINVGGYDVNMIYGLEDWEFWIALLKKGGEVYRINKICFFYRIKTVSMITSLNHS
ncbi:glycosyl transferase family 2, partial [Polaribacter sejongensis]